MVKCGQFQYSTIAIKVTILGLDFTNVVVLGKDINHYFCTPRTNTFVSYQPSYGYGFIIRNQKVVDEFASFPVILPHGVLKMATVSSKQFT